MENTEILDEFQNPSSKDESSLHIHKDMYEYLNTAAKWGNILAIIGFVMTGLGALFGLFGLVAIGAMATSSELGIFFQSSKEKTRDLTAGSFVSLSSLNAFPRLVCTQFDLW